MSRLERRHLVPIPEDCENGGGNTLSEILKSTLEEVQVDIIKRFLKIKFESSITFFIFRPSREMNDFFQNSDIVISAPTWQKAALVGTNNSIKNQS